MATGNQGTPPREDEPAHLEAIGRWLRGEISTPALLETTQSHFLAAIESLSREAESDRLSIWEMWVGVLDDIRAAPPRTPIYDCWRLRKLARRAILARNPTLVERIAAYHHASRQRRIAAKELDLYLRAAQLLKRSSGEPTSKIFIWQREEHELEKLDLDLSLFDLSRYVEKAPPEDEPLLRLLALRVVGGWSLREIAKRDGVSLDVLADNWAKARALLSSTPQNKLATVVTCEILDVHVLNAILSDRRLLHVLDWRTFEKVLAGILEKFGYDIELRRGTKDGGIDILALRRDDTFGPHRYLVQAKRWSNAVGVEPVRELLFLQQHLKATKACLATTSTFTSGAWALGSEYQWCLELRDYQRLQDWLALAFPQIGRHS
jgi:restriction endonuclease